MPELEKNLGDERRIEGGDIQKQRLILNPKESAAESYEKIGSEFIGRARSWHELYSTLTSIGGLTGSRFYSASELTTIIDSIRRLNKLSPLKPEALVFNNLTAAGGLRKKVKELIRLDNARENIARTN